MPLSGVICCRDGENRSFEDCVASCKERECVFPLPLLVSMSKNKEKRKGAGLSATIILKCPTQMIVEQDVDFFESPAEYHARWRGIGVHAMAEADGPYDGVIQETRIRKSINVDGTEIEITGQPDWFDTNTNHLDDWKSTSVCPSKPYDDHEKQLNIYAWLIDGGVWDGGEISDYVVDTASIVYIDPKRSVIHPVVLWRSDVVEDMIRQRLSHYVHYLNTGEILPYELRPEKVWKKRFCTFRGTGRCCSDP